MLSFLCRLWCVGVLLVPYLLRQLSASINLRTKDIITIPRCKSEYCVLTKLSSDPVLFTSQSLSRPYHVPVLSVPTSYSHPEALDPTDSICNRRSFSVSCDDYLTCINCIFVCLTTPGDRNIESISVTVVAHSRGWRNNLSTNWRPLNSIFCDYFVKWSYTKGN